MVKTEEIERIGQPLGTLPYDTFTVLFGKVVMKSYQNKLNTMYVDIDPSKHGYYQLHLAFKPHPLSTSIQDRDKEGQDRIDVYLNSDNVKLLLDMLTKYLENK